MNTNYKVPGNEVLSLIGKCENTTKEFAFAHKVCERTGHFKHFCALFYPESYIVTLEQKEQATKEFNRMKQERIRSIGNKLVFVGMGSSYTPRFNDDVSNYRIRTTIKNPQGRTFFIELSANDKDEKMYFDFVIDRDMENEYDEKVQYFRSKIKEAGGYSKITLTHPLRVNLEKYQSQPYYWYKKNEWWNINLRYTFQNCISIVNKLFDCHFTEMEIECCLLSPDDYQSISPA